MADGSGLATSEVLLGDAIESMTDGRLAFAAAITTLFARVSPAHKTRIIKALQSRGRTVGFIGDGFNDASAPRAADVGISVDTAVDIAKEAADMILLGKSCWSSKPASSRDGEYSPRSSSMSAWGRAATSGTCSACWRRRGR